MPSLRRPVHAGFDSFGDYMQSGAIGGAMGVTTAAISQLSIQSTGMLRASALRTADLYAQRFPRMTSVFERVRGAGSNRAIQAKLKVSELVDLLKQGMGGPRGPGSLQLAGGMDFRLLPPDTQVRVRLSADEIFNRPAQMTNGSDNAGGDVNAPGQAKDDGPAIKIESVDVEPAGGAPTDDAALSSAADATESVSSEPSSSTSEPVSTSSPSASPEAARLLAKGLPETTIAEVVTKFGQPGLQAVDQLVAEGVPPTSAVEALKAAQRAGVADDVIELVNSGKLKHPETLRKFLTSLADEVSIKQYGKRNELLEAKSRAENGHDVSIGGSKFDKTKAGSGQADVVQYGKDAEAAEAIQMKTVTGADDRAVASNLDRAVSQLKGKGGEGRFHQPARNGSRVP